MSDTIVVFTIFAQKTEAQEMGMLLLKKRLIACAQVSGPTDSFYWWKGKIEHAEEYKLVMKSRSSLWQELEKEIRLFHPYDVPEILAVPATEVSKDFEQWLLEELQK